MRASRPSAKRLHTRGHDRLLRQDAERPQIGLNCPRRIPDRLARQSEQAPAIRAGRSELYGPREHSDRASVVARAQSGETEIDRSLCVLGLFTHARLELSTRVLEPSGVEQDRSVREAVLREVQPRLDAPLEGALR